MTARRAGSWLVVLLLAAAAACSDDDASDGASPDATASTVPTGPAEPSQPSPPRRGEDAPSTSAPPPASGTPGGTAPGTVPGQPRDPWLRPFRSDSIWNVPIGSGAEYVPAGLPAPEEMLLDPVILERLTATDPVRPLRTPGSWTDRCGGGEDTGVELPIPDDFVLEDAQRRSDGSWDTPNHVAALLLPDGRTILNTNALARCEPGGPVFGYQTGEAEIDRTDLYGDGRLGSHGASRLSGLGGAIRPGELTGDEPIAHVLDLLVWSEHLWYDDERPGYRWPAEAADSYAAERYDGENPELVMGSLVALAPDLTADDLGVQTDVGRRLFAALQDYGAYITDDSGWDAAYFAIDRAADGTFPWGDAERDDARRMIEQLSVVRNNGEGSVGGGGTPRQPLLPELIPPG